MMSILFYNILQPRFYVSVHLINTDLNVGFRDLILRNVIPYLNKIWYLYPKYQRLRVMKKIIVPVDFSELSMYAMDFAVEFSKVIDSEIVLIHVLPFPMAQYSFTKEANRQAMLNFYTEGFIKEQEVKLVEWAKLLAEDKVKVKSLMLYGNPYHKISHTVAEEKADYIIMGSKGASGLKEFLLGSNAARMVRFADCPVIIIKDQTYVSNIKSLAFATDGTEGQDAIAEEVKFLQVKLGLPIHLVKVKTPYNWLEDSQLLAQLETYAQRNGFENYTTHTVLADFADDGATMFGEEHGVGLILIGTHGKTGLGHLFSGSTAEHIVNQSKIPVMTFKLD